MNQTSRVRRVERRRYLGDHRSGAGGRHRTLERQELSKVVSVDVAHRNEQRVAFLAGLVDRDDVRVLDQRGRAELAFEPSSEGPILGQGWSDELEGHASSQRALLGEVDDTHTSPPEDPLDAVGTEGGSGFQLGRHRAGTLNAQRLFLADVTQTGVLRIRAKSG